MERLDGIKIVKVLMDAGMAKDKAIIYVSNTYKIDLALLNLAFKDDS